MSNIQNDFISGIGNTPLIKLRAASEITGCNIYGKAEFLNPGGSVKDRAALALIKDAQEKKLISKGGTVVEGTAGNTGIGLGLLGNSLGYKTNFEVGNMTDPGRIKSAINPDGSITTSAIDNVFI